MQPWGATLFPKFVLDILTPTASARHPRADPAHADSGYVSSTAAAHASPKEPICVPGKETEAGRSWAPCPTLVVAVIRGDCVLLN